ncbi:MAG: flagellar biosynthesis protein [Defluviitaleaceae bacterium]|nr:flagellar biosynthesis protein [Defluviitaleaceae bacterium]
MISNMRLNQIGGVNENSPRVQENATNPSVSFREIFGNRLEENVPINFSKHAALRLNDRNINLSSEQMQRVTDGIGKANEKGIRDSLVLVDDVALVVNIKSRTVITAISQPQENIFSNIDGAVIV